MPLDFGIKGLFTSTDLLSTNSKFWSCSGMSFLPANSTWGGTRYQAYTNPIDFSIAWCFAVANLPDDVTISSYQLNGTTNKASTVKLIKTSLINGTSTELGSTSFNTLKTISSTEVVDNSRYAYFIFVNSNFSGITSTVFGAFINYDI